jgi:predicted DNA-binding WGR domain protein
MNFAATELAYQDPKHNSNKFYRLVFAQHNLFKNYGRQCAEGELLHSSFATVADARAEYSKLIYQKERKGYSRIAEFRGTSTNPITTAQQAFTSFDEAWAEPASRQLKASPKHWLVVTGLRAIPANRYDTLVGSLVRDHAVWTDDLQDRAVVRWGPDTTNPFGATGRPTVLSTGVLGKYNAAEQLDTLAAAASLWDPSNACPDWLALARRMNALHAPALS